MPLRGIVCTNSSSAAGAASANARTASGAAQKTCFIDFLLCLAAAPRAVAKRGQTFTGCGTAGAATVGLVGRSRLSHSTTS